MSLQQGWAPRPSRPRPRRDETETSMSRDGIETFEPIKYWQSACGFMRRSLIMQPIIAVALMLQQNSNTRPITRLNLTTITCQNLGIICKTLTAETETLKTETFTSRPRPRRTLGRSQDRDIETETTSLAYRCEADIEQGRVECIVQIGPRSW